MADIKLDEAVSSGALTSTKAVAASMPLVFSVSMGFGLLTKLVVSLSFGVVGGRGLQVLDGFGWYYYCGIWTGLMLAPFHFSNGGVPLQIAMLIQTLKKVAVEAGYNNEEKHKMYSARCEKLIKTIDTSRDLTNFEKSAIDAIVASTNEAKKTRH